MVKKINTLQLLSILKKITQGILITVLITFLIFWAFTTYGATFGCFQFLDNFFGMQGYESCGVFGFDFGLIIGIIVSIIFVVRTKSKK